MNKLWIRQAEHIVRNGPGQRKACPHRAAGAREGLPLLARLRGDRVDIAVWPRDGRPRVRTGQVILSLNGDKEPVCWIALPAAVTIAMLRRIFYSGPCRTDLDLLLTRAALVQDSSDVEGMLNELVRLRRAAETHIDAVLDARDSGICEDHPLWRADIAPWFGRVRPGGRS